MLKLLSVAMGCLMSSIVFSAVPRKIPEPMTLKERKPTAVIQVKDGDSIELTAGFIRDKVASRWITRLAYNGMIPGPTIIAPKGAKIKLKLINKTGEPTALHSHGLRVDDKNDGVVGIGQDPILHNSELTYELKFPDAGLFWYHPHMSDEYGQEMGLQGNFWVTDSDSSRLSKVDREELLVVDDILLEQGQMPGFRDGGLSYALMGRYGNVNLINNRPIWKSKAKAGDVVRYWITNTANARPYKLTFTNAKMKLVGSDSGLYSKDILADEIILAPSERAVVDVMFAKPGVSNFENTGGGKKRLLGKVHVSKNAKAPDLAARLKEFETLTERKDVAGEFAPLLQMADAKPDFTMKLDATLRGEHAEHVMGGSAHNGGIEWDDEMSAMNAMMSDKDVTWRVIDPATGKENMDINWVFKKDHPVKIRIINDGTHHPMQHPMHFHGQRFLVVTRSGKREENLVWKDTVLVRAGETVDVILDNQNPGRWMGHCHISEHLGTGMMFGFEVR